MQRPRGKPCWQGGCRLTCFGGRGDLKEGAGIRGCKTMDAKLGEGAVYLGTLGNHGRFSTREKQSQVWVYRRAMMSSLCFQCLGFQGGGLANVYKCH